MADYHITNFPTDLRLYLKQEAKNRYVSLRDLTVAIIMEWKDNPTSLRAQFAKIYKQKRDVIKRIKLQAGDAFSTLEKGDEE